MKNLTIIIFLFTITTLFAQEHAWVYFLDKPDEAGAMANPLSMLSQRSLDRRVRQNINLNYDDVPISQPYINQIAAETGVLVRAKSKWLNAVHVYGSLADITALSSLSFVDFIEFADKSLNTISKSSRKEIIEIKNKFEKLTDFNYGDSYNQINQIRVNYLHELDYTGSSLWIAVHDAGFPGVDTFSAFQRIRDNNQILGGYNYVDRNDDFYQKSNHGTSVLSTIAGFVDGELIGTAPDAKFYLFITEDSSSETPLEESLWVEAAEKSDSLGIDIINTSLGYTAFDDSRYNHAYSDMDGVSTFIARGANKAAEKGMLLVTSAGNSGNNTYFNISTPADATNVFTVGAVDSDGNIANFSSYGPSYDNRIKPDVDAKGLNATVVNSSGDVSTNNGTSFSSPIMTGAIACFWEAFPNKTNFEIMQLIRESAHLYYNPTDQEGYGIPNFELAFGVAKVNEFDENRIVAYPNPLKETLNLVFDDNITLDIQLFDMLGKKLMSKTLTINETIDFSTINSGVYLLLINKGTHTETVKIIKQ